MASIGGYTVTVMMGEINPGTGQQVEEITRPGVNGVAYRRLGKRGQPFRVKTVSDFETETNAYDAMINFKALQGDLVTVVDQHDRTWNSIMCLQVLPTKRQKVSAKAGGVDTHANGYILTCEWLLQDTVYE